MLTVHRAVEIWAKDSLGLASYLNGAFKAPGSLIGDGHEDDSSGAPSSPADSASDESRLDVGGVLALHIADGKQFVLVQWAGHTIPTWHLDNDQIQHKLTGSQLQHELSDESSEFQRTCSPAAYTSFGGFLTPFNCCPSCEEDGAIDSFDYRLYVDASGPANVSVLRSFLECQKLIITVYEIYCAYRYSTARAE